MTTKINGKQKSYRGDGNSLNLDCGDLLYNLVNLLKILELYT